MRSWILAASICALMLCVQLGIGFSKRPPKPEVVDDLDFAIEQERR